MKRSERKILTTHVGSLPELTKLDRQAPDYEARLREHVGAVVQKQRSIGLDVINEGEYTKEGDWLSYVETRFGGFEARPATSGKTLVQQGQDREDFGEFYQYATARGTLFYTPGEQIRQTRPMWLCTEPITYRGQAALEREIVIVRGIVSPEDAFLTTTAPAMQVDDAWLPALWNRIGTQMGLDAFRKRCMTNSVAAFGAVLSAIAIAIAAAPALAQEGYPTKPIRMIVPYPPGGVGDTTARVLVPKWIELIGQQILVDNRPGAGANIGTEMVAKAAPDGYTIGFFDSAFVVNPSLYAKLPFDPLRDFTPIMLVARGPLLLVVHPAVAANNAIELVALAKAKPGAMSYASAGSGTAIHLGAEMLKNAAGLQIVHVPYKGAGPAVQGVVAGDVPMMFALPGTVRGHTSTGRLRPIAITGVRRFSGLPDVPTFAEAGVPGVDATIILQFMAPAKTPRPIINALFVSLQKVVNAPEMRERLAEFALDVVGADPDRTATLLREEMELWAKVVKSSGAKAE